ncbi:MAG: outer membrane beta-barrel protein, partial [Chitinophagaceae bacterium]|nr:outer membrane beta-barrel protein [Chitinophagaceae bacterium]
MNSNYQLPGKFEIGTDFNGNLRQRTTTFDSNNNLYLWNAYVEKRFLKEENLSLRFSFFDILDQNKGYDRYE